ncbi:MAG TPA: AGE family epimerase/isomerase [Bryobacteraceae bacterium]|nr:AGE family epimerase/isomerase [Bryobacteraceae bacterium]
MIETKEFLSQFRQELFEVVLPFWERHGIDHERGGFLCGLDHDGRLVHDRKFHWFQGRGIWLYSYLYNHFGRDPRHLAIARKAVEFLLCHAPQSGWWPEVLSREGEVLRPFQGDLYGMYFAVEGLAEYAAASGDERALDTALDLFGRLWREIHRPDFGRRSQGLWMVTLLISTRLLARWNPPGIAEMADESLDAILRRHYNPETGLNTEVLHSDFSRPPEEAARCVIGHSIECLWMAMDEALRRDDPAMWKLAAERIRHHLDVGWDHVYGGVSDAVNVDHPEYEWPVDHPVETGLEFRQKGEYHYMKSLWAVNEVQVATLPIYERTGAEWAARYFLLAQEAREQKFCLRSRGYPLYLLFSDRRFSFEPNTFRQDNYHLPRQLMFNIQVLERMAQAGA